MKMNETFKAALNPSWTVTDTHLIHKKKEVAFENITVIKEVAKASILLNGVWQVTANGKTYNIVFLYKDRERALKAIDYIKEKAGIKELELERAQAIKDNPLLSAAGMYQFAVDNEYGSGFSKSTGEKHFAVLEKNLLIDEVPIMTFIGLYNYQSTSPNKHSGNYAFALTNKRIILGQWKLTGESFQSIKIENINDITFSSGLLMGVLTVDTLKETFSVGLDKNTVQKVNLALHEGLEQLQSEKVAANTEETITQQSGDLDDLIKYKELLDLGVITQDDFNQKKQQILKL